MADGKDYDDFTPPSSSVERIRAAVEQQQQIVANGAPIVVPPKMGDFRFGVLTFTPPDTAGQFVAVRVPIGELVARAAHSVAASQHRRAERAAHDEVVKALADFQNSQPK